MIHIYEWCNRVIQTQGIEFIPKDIPLIPAWDTKNKIRLCSMLESCMIYENTIRGQYDLFFNDIHCILQQPHFDTVKEVWLGLEALNSNSVNTFFEVIGIKFQCTYIGVTKEDLIVLRFKLKKSNTE